jgi:parallel beta-helix repeat protein
VLAVSDGCRRGSRAIAKKELMFGNILTGRRRAKLALLGTLLAACAVSLAATAPSSRTASRHTLLACGATVTTSVTLTSDLTCSGSNGLNVGADGITIDLNGHTISDNGTHFGIRNNGHTKVVIENGTLSFFFEGVDLESGANNNTVQNVRAESNALSGIALALSNGDKVTGNYAFSNGGAGIIVDGGQGNQLTGNWVEANSGSGIGVDNSTAFLLSGNKALDNDGDGIAISTTSSDGQLTGNLANANSANGIGLGSNTAMTLTQNRASFNDQLGINAAVGDSDGGKNAVQDNGSAKQCANVVCAEVGG